MGNMHRQTRTLKTTRPRISERSQCNTRTKQQIEAAKEQRQRSRQAPKKKLQCLQPNCVSIIYLSRSLSVSLRLAFRTPRAFCVVSIFFTGRTTQAYHKALAQHARTQAGMHESSPRPSRARAGEGRRTCPQMQRIIAPLPTRKARHAACGTKAAMKEHLELPLCPIRDLVGRYLPELVKVLRA